MTGTAASLSPAHRRFNVAHVGLALLIGAALGASATFAITDGVPASLGVPASADAPTRTTSSGAEADGSATRQYVDWYLRPSIGARSWLAETAQYTAHWYEVAADLAGSTTATEQYYSHYLGDR
jgi:hypothetical protein